MEHSVRKKKKHWGLRILGILLLLAILLLLIQAIRLVPTARRLQTAFSAQNCGITARVTLDRQELTADQQRFLRSLSLLAGLDEREWDRLKLQGGYEAGAVRLAVYGGEDALLTRLYLTQDCQAVDIRAIYDRAYANLTEKVGLLSHVLPQWNLGEYVALQQLERAFGLQVGTFPDLQSGVERLQIIPAHAVRVYIGGRPVGSGCPEAGLSHHRFRPAAGNGPENREQNRPCGTVGLLAVAGGIGTGPGDLS